MPNTDRVTDTLTGPLTVGQRFNDIGDAIQSVIAGHSTFGEAMNASRAARLREALATEQVRNNRARLGLERRRLQAQIGNWLAKLDQEARSSRNNAVKDVWNNTLKPIVGELVKTDLNKAGKLLSDFHDRAKGLDENTVDYPTLQGIAATVLRNHDLTVPENPRTDIAKLRADFNAGLISREDFDTRRKSMLAGGRGATPAQVANNVEIMTARQRIRAIAKDLPPGVSLRQELVNRTRPASSTGRENPNFDPMLARDLRSATQRRVGDDDDYEAFLAELDVRTPAPETPAPAPVASDPIFETNEARNLYGAIRNRYFGDNETAELPLTASGEVDAAKLERGKVYATPNGERWRWNGLNFVPVE